MPGSVPGTEESEVKIGRTLLSTRVRGAQGISGAQARKCPVESRALLRIEAGDETGRLVVPGRRCGKWALSEKARPGTIMGRTQAEEAAGG